MIIIMTFTAIFKSNDLTCECDCWAKCNKESLTVLEESRVQANAWYAREKRNNLKCNFNWFYIPQFDFRSNNKHKYTHRLTTGKKPSVSLYQRKVKKVTEHT